jgi:hypothetical protein
MMKGYLQQLIARHQGTADLVQPRVRSIFEPPSLGLPQIAVEETVPADLPTDNSDSTGEVVVPPASVHFEKTETSNAPEQRMRPDVPAPEAPPVERIIRVEAPAQPPPPFAPMPEAPARPGVTPVQVQSLPPPVLSADNPESEIQRTAPPPALRDAPTRREPLLMPKPEPASARLTALPPLTVPTNAPAASRVNQQEIPSDAAKSAPPVPVILPDRPGEPPPTLELSKPTLRLDPMPEVDRLAAEAVLGAEKPEKTVHISIGRLEVRMTNPPENERPVKAPAQPRTSLRDYMQRRNGK